MPKGKKGMEMPKKFRTDFTPLDSNDEMLARTQAERTAKSRRNKNKEFVEVKVASTAHTSSHWVFTMRIYYKDNSYTDTNVSIKKN